MERRGLVQPGFAVGMAGVWSKEVLQLEWRGSDSRRLCCWHGGGLVQGGFVIGMARGLAQGGFAVGMAGAWFKEVLLLELSGSGSRMFCCWNGGGLVQVGFAVGMAGVWFKEVLLLGRRGLVQGGFAVGMAGVWFK